MIYPIAIPGPGAVAPSPEELRLAEERKAAEEARREAIRAERAQIYAAREAANVLSRETEVETFERPFRAVADILARRLGPDLAEFADKLRRCDMKVVLRHLQQLVLEQKQAERSAADALNRAADEEARRETRAREAEEASWRGLVT